MNTPKTYAIVLLSLTTLGGAALAWRQYQELAELRAAALNKDERADLQKRIWDLERANRDLSDQIAAAPRIDPTEMEGVLAGAEGEQPARPERGQGGNGRRGGQGNIQAAAVRELMAKPEVQAMMDMQRKLAIEQRYAALFKNLNLSPEQADKLRAVLADRQHTMQDVIGAARDEGITPRTDPEGFKKVMADAQAEIANRIRDVIGDSGLAQLQNYEQTMPQRNLVNDLQQRLSYSNTPLTSTQADQLVQILAANAPQRNPQGGGGGDRPNNGFRAEIGALAGAFMGGGPGFGGGLGGGFGGGGGGGATVTAAALNQAQTVLSQPQLSALQQIQQQQQAAQKVRQLVNETLAANQPANGKQGGAGKAGNATNQPRKKTGGD